jgi:hypothetical protein
VSATASLLPFTATSPTMPTAPMSTATRIVATIAPVLDFWRGWSRCW